jgi:hypothetical protein
LRSAACRARGNAAAVQSPMCPALASASAVGTSRDDDLRRVRRVVPAHTRRCSLLLEQMPASGLPTPARSIVSARSSITLVDLVGLFQMLEFACRRCDRRGLSRLDRLIAEHGAAMGLPVLGQILAGTCPHAASVSINDRCGVHFPQLSALFPARPQR